MESPPVIVNLWAAPRSCSTSMMYSWAQREDTLVIDEPLYAQWLVRHPEIERPYKKQLFQSMETDGAKVVDKIMSMSNGKQIIFLKHVGKQLEGLENSKLVTDRRCFHIFLIRNRVEKSLDSFDSGAPVTLEESCYPALVQLYSKLDNPLVLVSEDVLESPARMLKAMTSHVGVAFDERMLAWTAGPKDYEGCWADLWYRNSRRSTGFSKSVGSHKMAKAVSKNIVDLLEDVHPFWSLLKARAVRARDVLEASSPVDQEAAVRGGTHAFKQDDRNASILIGVRNGVTLDFSLVPRRLAKVSVLDAGFVLGDGVWEGIRLHKSKLLFWDEHVARLYQGAKALAMSIDLTKDELKTMVEETCVANGMESGVHIRLIVSRGEKLTPYQAPKATLGMPTIVIIPERKAVTEDVKTNGIKLITSFVRRARPDTQDPMINSLSKHQCIAACIQAEQARVNEALMLDPQGFVATCNSTNFFMVCGGQLIAPTTEYQLHGITRQNMLDLAERCGIQTKERNFSVTEVYSASECFVTGTFAGAIPVVEVDGREIGGGKRGEVTKRLQDEYSKLCDVHAGGQGGGVVEK